MLVLSRFRLATTPMVVGTLLLACGSGSDVDDNPIRDAGEIRDAGPRDVGVVVDVCNDNGVCDDGETIVNCPADCIVQACPDGEEGCACNSTYVDGDTAFLQDDCDTGMLCVAWDTLSGRNDLTGPLQSCVKPCVADADCGMLPGGDMRRCVDTFGFADASGIARICVDRLAEADEYCGPTKLTTPRVTGVEIKTGAQQVGCGGVAQCSFGLLDSVHPDEGVCLEFCGRPGDPACGTERPYCNPNLLTSTATDGTTINFGMCSLGQFGVGSWCRPTLDDREGLTELCDSSDALLGDVICVGVGRTYGLCLERCDTTTTPPVACLGRDPAQGPLYCVDGLLMNGGGLCMTPDCSNSPDTCVGDGGLGEGRFCNVFTAEGEGVCVDRRAPALAPSTVDSAGALTMSADDCQADDMALAQCAEGTWCVGAQNGGVCVVGCDRGAPNTFCEGALDALGLASATATCTAALGPDTQNGLCGGD